jgi:hypothetical protein
MVTLYKHPEIIFRDRDVLCVKKKEGRAEIKIRSLKKMFTLIELKIHVRLITLNLLNYLKKINGEP